MTRRAAQRDQQTDGGAVTDDVCQSLQLFALGLNSGEIAECRAIDRSTVQRHLAEAMIALRVASKLEAVVRAIHLGLIVLPMSERRGSPMSSVCPRSA